MANRLKFISQFVRYDGVKSISFNVSSMGGAFIFVNANQRLFGIINIIPDSSSSQNKIDMIFNPAEREITLSVSDNVVTITADATLWGETLIAGNAFG